MRRLLNALNRDELPFAGLGVGGLDVGRVALGVADLVELDQAGHALVGDGRQCSQNVGGFRGAGSLDGLERGEVGVIAHRGDGGDHVVAAVVGQGVGVGVHPILDAGVEFGVAALLIEGRDLDADVLALGGLDDHVIVPRVGAEQLAIKALRRGGLDDQLRIVCGDRGTSPSMGNRC